MKNLNQKEIKSIQQTSIAQYKENMQKEGKSKTPEYFANSLMLNYANAIIEDGLVTGYYNNGCKNIMKKDDLKNETPTCGNTVSPAVFVGQVLYREKSRRNEPSEIVEVTVGKVGKKYFYLTGWEERYPINKETLKYDDKNYSQSNFQLYRDKQEILDRKEKRSLLDKLQKHFNWSGNGSRNTLEQLRQAVEVLGLS